MHFPWAALPSEEVRRPLQLALLSQLDELSDFNFSVVINALGWMNAPFHTLLPQLRTIIERSVAIGLGDLTATQLASVVYG